MPDLIQLDDKRLKQLDGNIKQMVSSGASQDDVMKYAFDFKNQFGLKKKDGGEISSPTELPSVSREYLDKGQELADASFLKKIGEPDRSQLVSQYKSPDISLTQKPKKDYYSTKLEKGLIFDKEGQLYAPSSEALSKDITAAEQASLKKSTQKDLVEKSREMPVVAEPTEPTEEQGLLLNLVSSLDRGFAKNFISNPMKGLGTFLQGTTKNVLGGSGEGAISDALIKYGDYLNSAIDELTPQDEEFKNSLWDQAAQALGQVGSLILTGGLTGASSKAAALVAQAPKGAVATAASRIGSQLSAPTSISAGLSMGQAEFDRAIQAGATDDQAFEVFYKNAVTGSVLETIPVMQFFKRFNKSTAGGLVNYLKTKGVAGFTGGVEEMTTEILQQVYANKTAKDIYNINQSILDGVGSSGGIGFGVGFLLNAMGANARILRKQGKEQDAIAIENQIEQYEDNLKNPKVTSGNTAKDIVTQGVEIGTQKAVQDLDRDLANNVITTEKYQEGIAFAEKAAQVADKIPETVTGESKVKSVELLVERNDIKQANQNLLQQKQTTDEAYHAGIDEEIKANEEKIKKIDSEVYDITKKPSKEFGTKKYEIDGEEVSQEAFEALTGKPIGTKEIIEVKPVETYEDKVKEILMNQMKAEGYRYMGAPSDLAKIPIEDVKSDVSEALKSFIKTTDGLPIRTVYRLRAEFEAKGYGDIPDGTKLEDIKDKIDSLKPSKRRSLEDDIYRKREEELDSLSYLPMTIKDDMTAADKKRVQDRREDIKKINDKYDAELAAVEVKEDVEPTEDINKANVTIEGTTDGYKVISGDKANSIGDIRQEANEARAKGQDTFTTETIKDGKKIFTLTDTTVSDEFGRPGFKSASISFPEGTKVTMEDVMAKLKSELGVKEGKPTERKASPLKDIENLKGEQSNIRTEESRKIVNAVRRLEGLEPYTGPLDKLYSALKEADDYNASVIFSKLNNLNAAVEAVKNLPSYKGFIAEQAKSEATPIVKKEVKPTEVKSVEERKQLLNQLENTFNLKDRVKGLIDNGIIDNSYSIDMGRPIVIANIGGIKVPFYRSLSGTGGKTVDKWYPFFGFGKNSAKDIDLDWFVKGTLDQNEKNYNSPAIAEYSKILNSVLNYPRSLDRSVKGNPFVDIGAKPIGEVNKIIYGNKDSGIVNDGKGGGQVAIKSFIDKVNKAYESEVKPTEVKEDVKVEEVKKSKLEAYKEKYAQKQKIEPIKIEDNGNPIIAKDPAENDIAIAKLAKQDNPVEESSIKAIEGKAEGDIKAKLNEVIAEVDDKIKLATRIEMVAMNDLKTDEASFQNREGLNLKKVDDIVANYNPSEFDPIIYWTDANGQKYTLNHHRFAAAQKLKLDEIPAQKLTYPLGHPKEFQVVPATDKAEAIDFAINRSNANRSMETAVERAKALRKLQKTGTKEDVNKFLEREGKNKTKIQNIAALNENGKTIDALKMFGDAEDVQLQKETEQRSDWIGEARRRISGLTNEHENEMFDFLMDKDASKRITSKADFISKVTSLAGGFDFNPENPLNLKRFKYQTEGERAYDERTGQLKSEIDTRQTKIDDLKARFSDPSRKDYIPTDSRDYEQTKKIADDQISKLNTEIKSFQQKLQEHYKEKGKYQGGIEQGGLFATEQATTEDIDDMANIVKDFYDDGMVKLDDIKREVAKELGFNNKSLEDVVERAYNKMVMEYTPVEISKGVIGKVGEKLNELGEEGVVMLEDDQSIFAKAAQLEQQGGGDIKFEFEAGFRGTNDMLVAYRYDTDQVARERFDIPKLKKIGEGSDRVVFDLKDGKVLKVAKTPRGLEQNIYEGDYYLSGTILPETFERGLNYVVVEKISPAITRTIDLGIADINIESDKKGIGKLNDLLKKLKQFTQKDFDNNDGNLQDILAEYDLTDIMNYDVIWNDFTAKRNWGLKDGEPLHLDGGTFGGIQMLDRFKGKKPLSDSEFRDIYNKSKKAKIENKDVDKFTKFMVLGKENLAPNGKKSNLTPEQYVLVRTPNFKKWFGDWENDPENASKVIDENGEPLVVYHGSIAPDIEVFDRELSKRKPSGLREMGFYFTTNKELAEFYSTAPAKEGAKNIKSKVYQSFLNLKTVKEFDAKGKNGLRAWDQLQVDAGYKIAQNRDAMDFLQNGKFGVDKVDGIIARNISDMESYGAVGVNEKFNGTVFLVFDDNKNSIKSATDNTGAFSTTDDRINYMAKPSGDILGFTYGKTIYLNASKINPNTPIHEGGHIWTKWVKNNDPRLYDRGMELVKNSKYLERAKASKFYQEQAAKLPQGEREAYFQEEALAMAIGDKGAQFVAEAKKSSFKEWLDNLWNAIKNAAGFDNITAKELQNLTFDEFAKRAARDILSPKSEQLKPTQNAIQEQSAKEKVPRAISTGENITEGGERVRPSKQRTKITAESKGDEEAVRMRSLYKQVITRSKGLTEEQKSILKNDPNALYTVLPIAESKRIALELIQEMGVAEAVAEASSSTTTLQPVERTMILGAAMDYYAKLGKEKLKNGDMPSAQTAARKEIDANEELRRVASTLGQLGTDYGRAINAFKEIYKLSSLALERKLVKDVEELNEEREEGATEDAKQIKKIITEDASDIEDVADELTNEEVESKLDAAKKVSDLEKQVENLRREILERDKAQKGTKKNPLRIKRITNDTEYDKRLKDFKQRARSIASKDDLVDLTYFGLYHIENGITKFADWYKEMSKNFKGFRSQFKNIYNSVAEKAAENGADRNMFDNDEKIQSVLDDFQQETDAKKIVQATKKVAQAKLKREEENNPERAVKIAPSLAAERIRKDAEKNLDMPSTEVEQTYLKRLVKVINNKAKEYYAEKKENISNVNDVLAFAIANGKKDFAIWERTQTELEEQIDEDEKLTEDEKEEVKDFLQAYRESIFETLLTKNQISEAVREKLIENGYFVERIVKGTPVKSVDWSKITGNATTLKEAKEKIVKSITDLGFTEAQAKGEINAILDYFDAKISEKKTAEINKYLQKGILNKVKALGKKKVKRNSVDKLVELNKKGLLDDAKIKEILAAELGLMEITSDDLKNLREWSSKVDDENTPIFIRKEFEEKIQYLFDTKSGNINYLENRAASMSNRLSSVVNQVINLTGFLRAPSTLITVAITTGKPIAAARVFLKELVNATQEAKTIMKGRVSRGSSFDDLIGTTSGQPRTRYLEQGKGKFLGGRALGKSIYVQIGGNKVDLNPVNFGYSKIKYISRLLESADTMASGPISGITQFRIATKDINRYYPELSAAQRSQKVYDILYTVDMAVETPKAIKDLKNAGVTNPTEAEINRTINERVERARGQRLAEELYQAAKSLNLISETKLKSDGIANPTEDEILAQSYKTLGSTQAADLVARGERQAARETGKMTTRGITSFILLPVDMVQKSLNSGLKSNSKAVTTLSEIGDVSFSVLMPFANSIARWAEMTAELFAPYGIAKGASYKIGAKFTSKKSKISAEEYSDLGDDYLIRGTQGLAMTLLIMYAVGMLNKAEDDEQEELGKSFTGTAKEKQYALEKVQSVGKPKQSVNILGTNVSLAFLGNQGLAIGMYADFLKLRSKRKLDENMTERGELFISGLAAMEAFGGYMFDATYLSTAKKYGSAASSLIEMKEEGYMPTLGRLAGGIISSQIPFNRLQVEAATLFNPKSQSSKDFGSNLLAQMSITRAFQSGKPNFDYRGREYDYGDIYANSADGIRKMFGKAKYGDEIDAFLSEINFAATDAYRETRDEDNYKFSILNPDETKRFMTNEEYYEFKKKTANKFNEYIKEDYKDIKDEVVDEGSLADVQKQIVSQLLSDAKSNAFIEIQEATGFDDAQYLRQLAKEKEKAQKVISKIKKYYKK